ncbi:uncharacterized protein LOC134532223 [Bacillus rossius redtenbacheri]|uniref:uncharacterized protein LOC134532223 n=1 Tax=Bacillus rossius redtenbacheri TaxID=93214 RepID=UPI002FDE89C0
MNTRGRCHNRGNTGSRDSSMSEDRDESDQPKEHLETISVLVPTPSGNIDLNNLLQGLMDRLDANAAEINARLDANAAEMNAKLDSNTTRLDVNAAETSARLESYTAQLTGIQQSILSFESNLKLELQEVRESVSVVTNRITILELNTDQKLAQLQNQCQDTTQKIQEELGSVSERLEQVAQQAAQNLCSLDNTSQQVHEQMAQISHKTDELGHQLEQRLNRLPPTAILGVFYFICHSVGRPFTVHGPYLIQSFCLLCSSMLSI